MRKLLLLLALAGCDSSGGEEDAQAAGAPAGAPPGAQPAAAQAGAAQLEERARASLGAILPEPESMRFGDLRVGGSGSICGRVEARQPDGNRAVRPFVVTPEGVAVVSTTPQVQITDPEDPFPDFYIRWCASPAELARLQPEMIGGETLGIGKAPPPEEVPEIPDVPPDLPVDLAGPTETPKERPAERAKAEPPPRPPVATGDDSFFNVVARPGGKE